MKTIRYVIVLLWCLAYMAFAFPATVSWVPVVSDPPVTEYRVYRFVAPSSLTRLATVNTTSAIVEVSDGWQVVVTAWNGSESPPSAPLTMHAPSASTAAKVTLQISSDLNSWTDWQVSEIPQDTARFFRLKTETP